MIFFINFWQGLVVDFSHASYGWEEKVSGSQLIICVFLFYLYFDIKNVIEKKKKIKVGYRFKYDLMGDFFWSNSRFHRSIDL